MPNANDHARSVLLNRASPGAPPRIGIDRVEEAQVNFIRSNDGVISAASSLYQTMDQHCWSASWLLVATVDGPANLL
ncbi:hypothetical protein [Sphingomonas sp.]|uniref:hypothetical protein n=1 Tax=Sphingomonas sp. TaxID=28214 RepID=UPI001DABF81D|nr:hypothetical protein [Sphingomonas sp.]MBX9797085.1 hypothetical protein [Sphingomonas sp.]